MLRSNMRAEIALRGPESKEVGAHATAALVKGYCGERKINRDDVSFVSFGSAPINEVG